MVMNNNNLTKNDNIEYVSTTMSADYLQTMYDTAIVTPNLLDTLIHSNEILQETFRSIFYKPQHFLVKDDVFFTEQEKKIAKTIHTPCLSPVTSPSDFLYDQEPLLLFDGGIDYEQPNEPLTPNTIIEDYKPIPKKKNKKSKTLFEKLTQLGIDWCRYCGTTEGVNWRPGPWGKRTLCNKHGCDYKGYGLASRLPRLDLSAFTQEKLEDRRRPIVQQFCVICQSPEKSKENKLIPCDGGCSRAYHENCYQISLPDSNHHWYCTSLCKENKQKNKVVVDLPRKYLPLMKLKKKKNCFITK